MHMACMCFANSLQSPSPIPDPKFLLPMMNHKFFWDYIATRISALNGNEPPSEWRDSKIKDFLDQMDTKLVDLFRKDSRLAEKCGLSYPKNNYDYTQFRCMVPSTFRRLFRYDTSKKSSGNVTTKNKFAIFLGYQSFEDLIRKEKLSQATASQNAVGKSYNNFIGRRAEIDKILHLLDDKSKAHIIGIDGMGGIGKTALAQEIVDSAVHENLFEKVVWMAANKPVTFLEAQKSTCSLTVEEIMNKLIAEIQPLQVLHPSFEQKQKHLIRVLKEQPILLVLDNVDTAYDEQEKIVQAMQRIFYNSSGKVLLTSRKRFNFGAFQISLTGLSQNKRGQSGFSECVQFIYQEATEKNRAHLMEADPQLLQNIALKSGGSPKAMQLVVGQLGYRELDFVLRQLQQIEFSASNLDGNEYVKFYKSIFYSSYTLLSKSVVPILIIMSHFVPYLGCETEKIESIYSKFEKKRELPHRLNFDEAINELWRMAFLERRIYHINLIKYYLHPLTQFFIKSDVVKLFN